MRQDLYPLTPLNIKIYHIKMLCNDCKIHHIKVFVMIVNVILMAA